MIPIDLIPRWRDVPALAWLAAGAFRARRRGAEVVSRAGLWLVFVAVFAASRMLGELAAVARAAVVIVTERPGRSGLRSVAAGVAALVMLTVPALVALVVVVAGMLVSATGAVRAGQVLEGVGVAVFVAAAGLVFAAVCAQLRWRQLRELPRGRRWSAGQYPHVMEASTLAVDPAHRGTVTALVRRLLTVADEQGYAVLAYAGDAALARKYARLGFRPVPSISDRMLCRSPGARRSERPDSSPRDR